MSAIPRYVELVRVSSTGQEKRDTPEDQRRALDALRVSRPGVLVERIDSTVSGAMDSDDRADIRRLSELAREHAFDELRVRHTDRLTRHDDPRERFLVYGVIADAGAVIVDATGRVIDPKSELGELSYYFETLMSSQERKRIAQRTMAAKARLAKDGRLVQGPRPFARTFDKATGKWGVDAKQAAAYASMFALYEKGRSLSQIADKLNEAGIETARGHGFTDVAVGKLLRAKSAMGEYKTKGVTFQIPAVVDADTFNRVQRLLDQRSTRNVKWTHYFALLRKLLVCAECGSLMYVQPGAGGGRKHLPPTALYYFCRTCKKAHRPTYRYHRADDVDARFHRALLAALTRPDLIERIARQHDPDKAKARAVEDVETAREELRKLDREEDRLANLTVKGFLPQKKGEALLAKLQASKREWQSALQAAEERIRDTARAREASEGLRATVERLRAAGEAWDPAKWREHFLVHVFRRGDVAIKPDGTLVVSARVRPIFTGPGNAIENLEAERDALKARLAASDARETS